jgi:tetratricopeptide (TPR) repeat protein
VSGRPRTASPADIPWIAWTVGVVLSLCGEATAQTGPLSRDRWSAALEPRAASAERIRERAEQSVGDLVPDAVLFWRATQAGASPAIAHLRVAEAALRRREVLEAARRDANAALRLDPRNARAWSLLARVREQQDAPPPELIDLHRRAVTLLDRDDLSRRAESLFGLGVAHTRLEQNAEARNAYEELVATPAAPGLAVALCNLAEVLVYLREIPLAIERYRSCAALLPQRATAWWGLAVAHDRGGQERDASMAADAALAIDPRLEDITGEGVFYVPPFERHYYVAIAQEARARAGGGDLASLAALTSWRAYLLEGGPSAPWLDRARAHVAAIEQALSHRARAEPRPPR